MSNSMAKIKISMNLILFDCNVMYFWIALCCAVLCCTVLYCTVLCSPTSNVCAFHCMLLAHLQKTLEFPSVHPLR